MVTINPYAHNRKEIDIRDEFARTLWGDLCEIGKAQFLILRRMRRNQDDTLQPCTCMSKLTREGNKDKFCAYCQGEGYLWDEEWMPSIVIQPSGIARLRTEIVILEEPGLLHPDRRIIFVPYDIRPTVDDRILKPLINVEGDIVLPLRIMSYLWIHFVTPIRSDEGRIEFWRISAREQFSGMTQHQALPPQPPI